MPKQQEAFQTPRFELTRDELISITGCVKRPVRESKKQMLAWLAKEGIQFRINLQGWPVVSREHACERFGRRDSQVKPQLNMTVVNNHGKTVEDCKEKFSNRTNFKGWTEPCKYEFSGTAEGCKEKFGNKPYFTEKTPRFRSGGIVPGYQPIEGQGALNAPPRRP